MSIDRESVKKLVAEIAGQLADLIDGAVQAERERIYDDEG